VHSNAREEAVTVKAFGHFVLSSTEFNVMNFSRFEVRNQLSSRLSFDNIYIQYMKN
jgi:hypothetical protein